MNLSASSPQSQAHFPDMLQVKIAAIRLMLVHGAVAVSELELYMQTRGFAVPPRSIDLMLEWLAMEEGWLFWQDDHDRFYGLSMKEEKGCTCELLGFSSN